MNVSSFTPALAKKAQLRRIQLTGTNSEFVVYAEGYCTQGQVTIARTKSCIRVVNATEQLQGKLVAEMPFYDAMACLTFRELSKQQKEYLINTYKLIDIEQQRKGH